MSYEIGNPEMAWLLLFAPIALILMGYSAWKNRNALTKFGAKPNTRQSLRSIVSGISLVVGIVFLALACMDIRWGKTTRDVPQKGLEVVFALDVSRSMLAEDVSPNRLARARQQINDMVSEMAGDRIGLVVFAGEAKQAIPLTNHYNDFRQKLDTVGPHSVSRGGSQLGVAIESAADAFVSKTNDHKTIILFTDGEDQESKPVELAKKLYADKGMRIFTVGLGDIDTGARIPQDRQESGQFIEHQGQQVWSKLNGSILREIATETHAAYIPAGTKRVNMADVYHNYVAQVEKSEFETAKVNAFIPRFQWFALPAFVCLLMHGWLTTTKNQNRTATGFGAAPAASALPLTTLAVSMLVLLPGSTNAQTTEPSTSRTIAQQINAANALVRQDNNREAIDAFNAIEATTRQERDALNYNLAIAHYGSTDFDAALTLFAESANSGNDRIAADSRYNIGNCHFAKSLPLAEQPDAAIQELKLAVAQYRSAIRLDRQHDDARENLERAMKLIKQLEEKKQQQNKNEDSKDQENQNDSPKDEDQQNKDQQDQQKSSDESQQSDNDQDQSESKENPVDDSRESESPSDEEEGSEENQSQQQQEGSQQSESQQDSDGESQSDQTDQDAGQQRPADQNKQNQQASGDPDDSQEGGSPESEAAEKEGKAPPQGNISSDNESKSDGTGEQSLANPNLPREQKKGIMSRQEALKLLQSVRDRDMIRRIRQQQRQRPRRVQVEKDW